MFRANNFDKLLDKATSNLRLDPDWPTILQICDLIRQNDCSPKYAVAAVKKKLYSQNPHQAMFALLTLESIVKNCGSGVHDEVTSKAFCEMLRDLVKSTQHENLRTKILELIQAWAFAFRNSPKYRAVQDTVNILKAEGFKFPALKESDAMFSADTAPEWADGEVCHRCRVAFSLMVRRHHCRACGQVFCQQCSSKTSTLPKFGIEKEVRVCDACFDKVSRPPSSTAKLEIVDTPNDYGPAQPQKRPPGKTAEELQEEEELQLALALSQSEAEHKEKERKTRTHIAPEPVHHPTLSPTPSSVSASPEHSTQGNAELSRYLDRNYWEQRLARDTAAAPTAPAPTTASIASSEPLDEFVKPSTSKAQEDDAEDKEIDEFVENLKSQVEIFVNRMKSNSSRGRSIANDTSVQTLFMNITAMHSKLLRYIQQQDDKRVYLESLQDKVNQIRDSRAALDTLRAEHAARLAAHAEAAERQRQMQMAAKLQAMRKKKHEYLQYQRQLALQRVQEQEREMQMRQEQQKHQYMMSSNSGYYMPGVTMPQYQPNFPNQPMYANPQFHPQMMPQATTDSPLPIQGQPQISQANIQLPNQMGPQTMPQMTNAFAMSTSGAAITANTQPTMNQANIRPGMGQQPLQQQMMMQQMHQMRMPMQPGMHQMMMQNGVSAGNANGQAQLAKQSLPNQPMIPPMASGQQNMQPMMNNQQMGMQMPNMRMPMMQGNPNQPVPVSGYSMTLPNTNMPQAGQPMSLPAQQIMQGQNASMTLPNHIPNAQNAPNQQVPQTQAQQPHQLPPGQAMSMPNQQMQPPGQMMQIPQMGPQGIPQGQMGQMPGQPMVHGQAMQHPGQMPMAQGQSMHQNQMNQQMPPGQPMQQPGQPMPQQGQPMQQPGQPMPQQGQPMQQLGQPMQQPGQPIQQPGQPMHQSGQPIQQPGQTVQHPGQPMQQPGQPIQQPGQPMQQPGQPMQQPGQPMQQPGQQMKIQQPPFNAPPGQVLPNANQSNQQVQTPVKSEHNNNTAELISFD